MEENSESSQTSVVSAQGTPQRGCDLDDEIETVRPTLSIDRSVMARTVTRVQLPSGKTLSIVSKPFTKNNGQQSGSSATPLSVKSNPKPRSLITNLKKAS